MRRAAPIRRTEPLQCGTPFYQNLLTVFSKQIHRLALPALLALMLALPVARADTPAPIRFLLTFDDGPSASSWRNPTAQVLDTLARNRAQAGIKAIFFTQTGDTASGASAIGRQLMQREHDEGHLLAFHTATARHSNHRYLSAEELDLSLRRGSADLQTIAGVAPTLVRPPFWSYDAATLAQYQRHGMQMLLTDLSANDGVIWGVNWSWHKRSNLLANLAKLRPRWQAGELPVVDGSTPVVVTFHDINRYTASVIEEYLLILLDVARELKMPTAALPFYDQREALEKAALAKTVSDASLKPPLPGLWGWIWR
jgi:peptidoglycan-N-acetylglucosamine deacetylase